MKCTLTTEYCEEHECIHGQEAERLRAGVEKLIETAPAEMVLAEDLQRLLDDTAADDSFGHLEAGDMKALEILVELLNEGLQPLVRDGLIDESRRRERANNIAMILAGSLRIIIQPTYRGADAPKKGG